MYKYFYLSFIVIIMITNSLFAADIKVTYDASVSEFSPNQNFGSDSGVHAGSQSVYDWCFFGKVDLSSIPSTATVTYAMLKFYSYSYSGNGVQFDCHRLTSGFSESSITWNSAPTFYTTYSATNGGGTGWMYWNITDLAQDWVDGSRTNYGFLIKPRVWSCGAMMELRSSEYSNSTYRPYLIINYKNDTPPGTVSLSSPSNNATSQPLSINFQWQQPSGTTPISYQLQVSQSSSFSSTVYDNSSISSTNQQVSGLSYDTTYYWRVRAKNSAGTGSYSSVWQLKTQSNPSPGKVTLSSPQDNATSQPLTVNFQWLQPSGATPMNYQLQVATSSNFSSTIFDNSSISTTSKQVSGLSYATTYYWRVRASNSAGTGSYSSVWKFTTQSNPTPGQVTLSSPSNNASSQPTTITLKWNQPSGSSPFTYQLQVSTNSSFSSTVYDNSSINTTSQQVSGLSYSTTYYWHVKAQNTSGWGSYSSTWQFTTQNKPSTIPGSVTLISPADYEYDVQTTVTFKWSAPTTGTPPFTYYIEVSKSNTFSSAEYTAGSISSTQHVVNGLSNSTTYYWRVRAQNSAGSGSFHTYSSFTTCKLIVAPSKVTLDTPADNATKVFTSVTLQWKMPYGSTPITYAVEVSENVNFTNLVVDVNNISGESYTVNGLALSTLHYWRVHGENSAGTGPWSNTYCFTTTNTATVARYALLLAGTRGGSDSLKLSFIRTMGRAYQTLIANGWNQNDIRAYANTDSESAYLRDLDSDGDNDIESTNTCMLSDVENGFTWLTQRPSINVADTEVFIYVTDHGSAGTGVINLTDKSLLTPSKLCSLINDLLSSNPKLDPSNVKVFVSCCHSGYFISALASTDVITITSCKENEVSLGDTRGYLIFDAAFFQELENGENLWDAMVAACEPISYNPQINTNGNSTGNEAADKLTASTMFLGNPYANASNFRIAGLTDITLKKPGYHNFNCYVIGSNQINKVSYIVPETAIKDVNDYMIVNETMMVNTAPQEYEANISFPLDGEYKVTVMAEDVYGQMCFETFNVTVNSDTGGGGGTCSFVPAEGSNSLYITHTTLVMMMILILIYIRKRKLVAKRLCHKN